MKKILVVDDDEDMIEMLEAYLTSKGYGVIAASTAKAAQKILAKSTPDLVLIDVMMPDMNGLELCRWIRDRAETKEIPVIQMSALGDEITRRDSMEAGTVDYLSKPFTMALLIDKVERAIARVEKKKHGA